MTSTPKYFINLPQPGDSMADVANGFNNAWVTIANAPKPTGVVAGSVLPTTGYAVGNTVYLQGWKSLFLCIGNDANWGLIWRPVHARWGPWVALTAGQFLSDITNWALATEGGIKYRVSNTGRVEFAGGIQHMTSGSVSAVPTGTYTPINIFPAAITPDKAQVLVLAMHKTGGLVNNNAQYFAKLYLNLGTAASIELWNDTTADATSLFFNNVQWYIADRTDL